MLMVIVISQERKKKKQPLKKSPVDTADCRAAQELFRQITWYTIDMNFSVTREKEKDPRVHVD